MVSQHSDTGKTFNCTGNGYTYNYACQSNGNDAATINGTNGNDRISGNTAFVILAWGAFIQ